jgi:hypothetical protein
VEFVCGQLDSLYRWELQQWDHHGHPNHRGFPLLHFLRYASRRCLIVLPGTDVAVVSGSQAWLYGGLLNVTNDNGTFLSYPTADYKVDGVSGELLDGDVA